ncbi:MAG: hypothetical protein GXY84_08515 [Clostridiales bacterium]|nr:hypothetical protein [Clostridiales bacterium]
MSVEQQSGKKRRFVRNVLGRIKRTLRNNWKLKLLSLIVAITIWGALISEDASLTREKTFHDVPVSITGVEALQRSGLVVVEGLDNLQPIRMRAEVPQKAFDTASPANYSVRVDVSRITNVGEQKIPIQTSVTTSYGAVTWLSTNEVTVKVEEYITRRRVPVRLIQSGQAPEGYFAAGASVDPATVVISGPRSLVEQVEAVSATYQPSGLVSSTGTQYSAVPFQLVSASGEELDSRLISVTSENVLLDTLLVEQTIYPMKYAQINLTGITKGQVMEGYAITSITAEPEQVRLAGDLEEIDSINLLDLTPAVDVSGMSDTIIRALRIDRPAGVIHLSESAVVVTIHIQPIAQDTGE